MSLDYAQRALRDAFAAQTSAELVGHLNVAKVQITKAIKQALDTAIDELEHGFTQEVLPLPEPADPGPSVTVDGGGVVLTDQDIADGPYPTISEADAKKLHRRGRGRPKAVEAPGPHAFDESELPTEAELDAKLAVQAALEADLAEALQGDREAEAARDLEAAITTAAWEPA